LLSPNNSRLPAGFKFAIDNGAWSCFQQKLPFDTAGFVALCDLYGAAADFVVVPDIVAGGQESLDFSKQWLDRLQHFRLILLAVQDGMKPDDVGALLERYPNLGIFLGGSTEWKLRTLYGWGMVAHAMRCWFHVGRVNTARRMRLCQEAGATSVDGTSVSMYASTLPLLQAAQKQPSLLTPKAVSG
jgi:hypothetical protein